MEGMGDKDQTRRGERVGSERKTENEKKCEGGEIKLGKEENKKKGNKGKMVIKTENERKEVGRMENKD